MSNAGEECRNAERETGGDTCMSLSSFEVNGLKLVEWHGGPVPLLYFSTQNVFVNNLMF